MNGDSTCGEHHGSPRAAHEGPTARTALARRDAGARRRASSWPQSPAARRPPARAAGRAGRRRGSEARQTPRRSTSAGLAGAAPADPASFDALFVSRTASGGDGSDVGVGVTDCAPAWVRDGLHGRRLLRGHPDTPLPELECGDGRVRPRDDRRRGVVAGPVGPLRPPSRSRWGRSRPRVTGQERLARPEVRLVRLVAAAARRREGLRPQDARASGWSDWLARHDVMTVRRDDVGGGSARTG